MIKNLRNLIPIFYSICLIYSLPTQTLSNDNSSTQQRNIIPLNKSNIILAIQQYIQENSRCEAWQIQLKIGQLPKSLPMIVASSLQVSCQKQTVFRGKVQNTSGNWQKMHVLCYVRRLANVLVATNALECGHVISGDEFVEQQRDVTNYYEPFPTISEVIGKRTKRMISAGLILTHAMVESLPMVQQGDMVTAFYRKKNITLTFPAKANQQGQLGDIILVRDLSNNRIVKAEIIEPGSVLIIL